MATPRNSRPARARGPETARAALLLPLVVLIAGGCSRVSVSSDLVAAPAPRAQPVTVPPGLVQVLGSEAAPAPECVPLAEVEGRVSHRWYRARLIRELRQETGDRGGNLIHILDEGPPSFGEQLMEGLGRSLAAGVLGSTAGGSSQTLVTQAVAMDCPPSEVERKMAATLAALDRPASMEPVAPGPEVTALAPADGRFAPLIVAGLVSNHKYLPASTYVFVSVRDRRALVDTDGRYRLAMRVPSSECEGLSLTVTQESPTDVDVIGERPLEGCGGHRVDIWR